MKLYIITGPAGVGKSTISKGIASSSSKSVLIEGDEIYHHVIGGYEAAWKEGNHLDVFFKVCFETIKIYLNEGYDVVFNYILNKENINKIKEFVNENFDDVEIKLVCLMVDEETIMKRDKERPEDCQMKERCLILLDSFRKKNFDQDNIIDTSNISIQETIDTILNEKRFVI